MSDPKFVNNSRECSPLFATCSCNDEKTPGLSVTFSIQLLTYQQIYGFSVEDDPKYLLQDGDMQFIDHGSTLDTYCDSEENFDNDESSAVVKT